VLSKLVAHTTGFFVTAVVVPTIVFAAAATALLEEPVDLGSLAAAVGPVALAVLFYIVLTLTLGTVFTGRGPVAGIGIAVILTGIFFKGTIPRSVVLLTPWPLSDIAGDIAIGTVVSDDWYVPIAATAVASVLLLLIALWRFQREEF
jgi:hypothetical protein